MQVDGDGAIFYAHTDTSKWSGDIENLRYSSINFAKGKVLNRFSIENSVGLDCYPFFSFSNLSSIPIVSNGEAEALLFK